MSRDDVKKKAAAVHSELVRLRESDELLGDLIALAHGAELSNDFESFGRGVHRLLTESRGNA